MGLADGHGLYDVNSQNPRRANTKRKRLPSAFRTLYIHFSRFVTAVWLSRATSDALALPHEEPYKEIGVSKAQRNLYTLGILTLLYIGFFFQRDSLCGKQNRSFPLYIST